MKSFFLLMDIELKWVGILFIFNGKVEMIFLFVTKQLIILEEW